MWIEVFLFVVVALLVRWYMLRPQNMPPGPFVIPFLGSSGTITADAATKGRKKYGDIYRTELFDMKFVFLCNRKLIKEAFSRPELADRPSMQFSNMFSEGNCSEGVIFSNGQHWVNARRFLLRHLRDLGMGKTYLEEAIKKEAELMVQDLRNYANTTCEIPKSVEIGVLNVVWQMIASTRYGPHDEKAYVIINILRSMEVDLVSIIFEFLPILRKIIPKFIRKRITIEDLFDNLRREGRKFGQEIIAERRAALDPDNPCNVIDEYLLAMDNKEEIAAYFSEVDLIRNIFDLFQAGFDTVSTTLRWLILYMAKFPEVQRRVQQQIDDVVPRDTLPSYEHKSRLALVEALYHEVLRYSSLLPLGLQRSPSTDMHLAGYFIPKDSWVFGCAVCCHFDPQYWDQPEEFRPERFLNDEGQFTSQKEGFLPFGIGRRACLGESLARMELYLFTAALLQNFSFAAPDGVDLDLEQDPRLPAQRTPKKQKFVITTRK